MKKKIKKRILACVLLVLISLGGAWGWYRHSHPLVSVVMCVYNRQDLVSRAIVSILNQTYKNFEFIIVDDSSKDYTLPIVEAFAKADSRIKVVRNLKNQGVALARQRGVDVAKGKYIAIMDSDDWSAPDRLEKSVMFMEDYPDVTAMSTEIIILDDHTAPKAPPRKDRYTVARNVGYYEVEQMFFNTFYNPTTMYRRDFVVKHGIKYNPEIRSAEDYDYWRQIVEAGGKMASIADPLVHFRIHFSNSSDYYSDMVTNALKVRKQMFEQFFTPTPAELKYEYSRKEKCDLLNKMKKANLTLNRMPQEWLDDRYAESCPDDWGKTLYLVHPHWSDFIDLLPNNRMQRHSAQDGGEIKIEGDLITILWDKWGVQKFKKQPDGSYKYVIQ